MCSHRTVPVPIASWFAVWSVGGAFVPLNPRVPDAERERAIAATGVAAVIEPPAVRCRAGVPARPVQAGEAIIQFTSGTTGRPKPVPLRHDTVLALLDGVIGSLRAPRTDSAAERPAPMPNLVPVSLSLWAGIYQVLFAFRLGVPVVLMERFEPAEFARLVREFGIRSSVLPPAAMVMLADDASVTSLEPLALRPQRVGAALADSRPSLPRPVRCRDPQRLRTDRAGWRGRRLDCRRLEAVRYREAGRGRPSARGHRRARRRRRAPGSVGVDEAGAAISAIASPSTAGCAPAISRASTTTASCGSTGA